MELDFLSYDAFALRRYRDSVEKENIEIPGRARNTAGGENFIATVYHSRQAVIQATHDAGLSLADEQDLWIDRETAVDFWRTKYTENANRAHLLDASVEEGRFERSARRRWSSRP